MGEILKALREDLQAGKTLIRIAGSEGSGKTMLCRLLLSQPLGDNFEVVFLDNPVGSFDDLLHVVCLDLGMEPAAVPDRDMLSELRVLLDRRREDRRKVVLVVDEAEKMFLATLERLMRAICDVGGHAFHVILVGRPALNANLDQLTVYCSDVDIEGGYVLEPFTEEETARYLNFRMVDAGLSPDSHEEIFTVGAVHKIFESAGGNPRLINILAEEALQASSTDKSFLVLLDHVAGSDDKPEKKTFRLPVSVDLPGKKKLFLGVGVLAVIVLLIYLFAKGGDEKKTEPVSEGEQPLAIASVAQPPVSPSEQVEPSPVSSFEQIEPSPESPSEEIEPSPESPSERIEPSPESPSEQREPLPESPPEQREPLPSVKVSVLEEEQPAAPTVERVLPVVRPDGIIELTPDNVKSLPEIRDEAVSVTVEPESGRSAMSESVAAVVLDSVSRNGEELYQERFKASGKWLAGAYRNTFSVQLMMLTSEQAALNIKKMLVLDEYFAIKDNLYILRKKTSPPTLFVFYGAYATMEQARQARNNMPLFLRKHHPYALSISDAMKKTED